LTEASNSQIKDSFNKIDLSAIKDINDLVGLGQVSMAIEHIANNYCQEDKLCQTLKLITKLCDWLIMANEEEGQKGRTILFEYLTNLTSAINDEAKLPDNEFVELKEFCLCHLPASDIPDGIVNDSNTQQQTNDHPAFIQPAPDSIALTDDNDLILYTEFISEGIEHMETIEVRVLDLEKSPDNPDIINDIFRPIHSIKGAAGFLGLTTTNCLCHELENLLDRARKLTLQVTPDIINIVLNALDILKVLIDNLQEAVNSRQQNEEYTIPPFELESIILQIKSAINAPPPAPPTNLEVDISKIGGYLVADGAISSETLTKALVEQKRPIGQVLVDMGATSKESVDKAAQKVKAAKVSNIKVDTDKLDHLMELVGELVIAESQVYQDNTVRCGSNMSLTKNVENLNKITRNLQDMVMSIRMVPLRQTFQKMNRLVRDTAQKTGKKISLTLFGEETEIDKTLIEEIADPMVHLLRNAVDHGISPPEERIAQNKPETGIIKLSAFHQGGNVVIEVTDDGQGLNRERILQKAIEKGLLETSGEELSDAEVFTYILMPGFSTAAVTTDISGRGVGMDVVKRNIEKLGGRIDINSQANIGTTFTIRLPLTMAITDGMLVKCGTERFIIPTLSIEESLRPTKDMLSTVRGQGEVIMVRNQLIPLIHLENIFSLAAKAKCPTQQLSIIVKSHDKNVGILVDELIGQQQVVIKNLGEQLRGIHGISGGCILGDGQVALILDIGTLIKHIQN
jgi:two-component system chemotaxis sensor kinase CheA